MSPYWVKVGTPKLKPISLDTGLIALIIVGVAVAVLIVWLSKN